MELCITGSRKSTKLRGKALYKPFDCLESPGCLYVISIDAATQHYTDKAMKNPLIQFDDLAVPTYSLSA